jgi:hypothetical protein
MASTHIEIATQTRSSAYIRQYVDDVARVVAEGAQLVRVLNAAATGGDYTAVEALYGLPTGTGQTVYNLVVGAESTIRSANTTALITQLG